MEVNCCHCGATVQRSPSQVRGRTFCSRACIKAASRPLVTCRGCAATFARKPAEPRRQYCTWECFKSSRHVLTTCQVCGDDFDSYTSEQAKRDERNHVACCSRSCRNVYTSRLLGGDGTWSSDRRPTKRGRGHQWRLTRAAYLKTVGPTCEGCSGAPVTEVHHLHPIAAGGEPYAFDNLMAVCRPCHDLMHDQLRRGVFWDSFEGAPR